MSNRNVSGGPHLITTAPSLTVCRRCKRPVLADHTCKEIPDHHIEHAWTLAAQALLQNALGATVPSAGDDVACPF